MSASTTSDQARAGWRAFRAHSVFFQLKVLVLAVYAVVVVATLLFVLAPRRAGPNDLAARVTVLPGDPIMGRYFVIQNTSRSDWLGVRFEITGGYQTRRDVVLAGEKVTLYLHDFTRQEAAKPPEAPKLQGPGKSKKRASASVPAVAPVQNVAAPMQIVPAPTSLLVTSLRIESRGRVAVFPVAPAP